MLTILQGDCLEHLRTLPEESVHCCVTSPPYWGLRDYGCDGQIGLEETLEDWVRKMVSVFREVRRVLRKDGTCWWNGPRSVRRVRDHGPSGPRTGSQSGPHRTQPEVRRPDPTALLNHPRTRLGIIFNARPWAPVGNAG